jgi:hypothetical protein
MATTAGRPSKMNATVLTGTTILHELDIKCTQMQPPPASTAGVREPLRGFGANLRPAMSTLRRRSPYGASIAPVRSVAAREIQQRRWQIRSRALP